MAVPNGAHQWFHLHDEGVLSQELMYSRSGLCYKKVTPVLLLSFLTFNHGAAQHEVDYGRSGRPVAERYGAK